MGRVSAAPKIRSGPGKLIVGAGGEPTAVFAPIREEIRHIYHVPTAPRVWSVSLADLGDPRLTLRHPLVVMLEDHAAEFVASWPEVEVWGSGASEAEALNELKDEIVRLFDDLSGAGNATLGRLPKRWKAALNAVIQARRARNR